MVVVAGRSTGAAGQHVPIVPVATVSTAGITTEAGNDIQQIAEGGEASDF